MTGFGYAEERGFKVEVRSVNHRFLDVHFRMPVFLHPYEVTLRKIIKDNFSRGRFDITVSLTEEANITIKINKRLAGDFLQAFECLQDELSLRDSPSFNHLFWFKDTLFSQDPQYAPEDLFHTFNISVKRLIEMRGEEGEHLIKDIKKLIQILKKLHKEVKKNQEGLRLRVYDKIKKRISELLRDVAIDDIRLLQEAAFWADKTDISEEVARIQSHILQMGKIISEGGTIGKKVDFLLQELLREINTIGSKSSEYRISDFVVQMKTVIEQIKEQIQNIQ